MPIHVGVGTSRNQLILTEIGIPDTFPLPVAVGGGQRTWTPGWGEPRRNPPPRRQTIGPLPNGGRPRVGKESSVSLKPRLVVVDHSTETADVLQAVFAPRGVQVERRRAPARRSGAPRDAEVFVLDEDFPATSSSVSPPAPEMRNRVVLGSPAAPPAVGAAGADSANYLPKPFQYAELIRAVETLLAEREAQSQPTPERRAA